MFRGVHLKKNGHGTIEIFPELSWNVVSKRKIVQKGKSSSCQSESLDHSSPVIIRTQYIPGTRLLWSGSPESNHGIT